MGTYLSIETVFALFQRGLDAGARPDVREDGLAYKRRLRWDIAGSCESPRIQEYWSKFHVSTKRGVPLGVELTVRCRKCRWCLAKRRNEWASKAVNEVKAAPRTWFLTLTLAPEHHYRAECAVRAAVAGYDSLPHDKRFRALLALVRASMRGDEPPFSYSRELTLFLKRVRKNSKARFRYLLVAEAHKSGLPHFHMLLHEVEQPIRKAVIKAAWQVGFSKVALCEGSHGALYLCKYLAKDASTRIRASFKYGSAISTHEMHSDSVRTMTPTNPEAGESRGWLRDTGAAEPPSEIIDGLTDDQETIDDTSSSRSDASGSSTWDETSGIDFDPFRNQVML